MLDRLAWLSLEVLSLDRATDFYREAFALDPDTRDGTTVFHVGDQELRLVEPGPVPRGGLHVHFAMATPPDRYDDWVDRLGNDLDVTEHDFGSSRSLYCFDPNGHCVEIGSVGDPAATADLSGIFEVVLEVEDLQRAEHFYAALGFSVVDRGETRPRVRMTGPVDLELWEPQRGLADARGGVHVNVGFTGRVGTVPKRVTDLALAVERTDDVLRLQDPDGHYLTVTES